MTDIDESETVSKAKVFWSKPPFSRDRDRDQKYYTQPKDHTKTTSNLDKNYEELTQKRGATEGALSSKVRKWEDSKQHFQKKETEVSDLQDLPDTKAKRSSSMVDIPPSEVHLDKKDDEVIEDDPKKKINCCCIKKPRHC